MNKEHVLVFIGDMHMLKWLQVADAEKYSGYLEIHGQGRQIRKYFLDIILFCSQTLFSYASRSKLHPRQRVSQS